MKNIASASILSADFCNLGRDIERAEAAGCEYIHFDVMDGVFVPNISYGIPILKAVSKIVKGTLDVHLMIIDPIKYVKDFADNGADIITFHSEAESDVTETINAIHSCGKKAGLAIKPNTPVSDIEQYLDKIDMLLVMTVEPGFGGQGFISETLDKIAEAKKIIDSRGLNVPIQVDGGINEKNSKDAIKAGANVLVAGSSVFKFSDRRAAIDALRG